MEGLAPLFLLNRTRLSLILLKILEGSKRARPLKSAEESLTDATIDFRRAVDVRQLLISRQTYHGCSDPSCAIQSLTGSFSQQHGRSTLGWRQPLPSWARQARLGVALLFFFLMEQGPAAADYACLTVGTWWMSGPACIQERQPSSKYRGHVDMKGPQRSLIASCIVSTVKRGSLSRVG